MCSKRSEEIDYWAGVTPLLGVKSQLAIKQKQYNLLTISILIITMSSFTYKGSSSKTMNIIM